MKQFTSLERMLSECKTLKEALEIAFDRAWQEDTPMAGGGTTYSWHACCCGREVSYGGGCGAMRDVAECLVCKSSVTMVLRSSLNPALMGNVVTDKDKLVRWADERCWLPEYTERFSDADIEKALGNWLEYGESSFEGSGHKGYYSGAGWAARVLRYHFEKFTRQRAQQ